MENPTSFGAFLAFYLIFAQHFDGPCTTKSDVLHSGIFLLYTAYRMPLGRRLDSFSGKKKLATACVCSTPNMDTLRLIRTDVYVSHSLVVINRIIGLALARLTTFIGIYDLMRKPIDWVPHVGHTDTRQIGRLAHPSVVDTEVDTGKEEEASVLRRALFTAGKRGKYGD